MSRRIFTTTPDAVPRVRCIGVEQLDSVVEGDAHGGDGDGRVGAAEPCRRRGGRVVDDEHALRAGVLGVSSPSPSKAHVPRNTITMRFFAAAAVVSSNGTQAVPSVPASTTGTTWRSSPADATARRTTPPRPGSRPRPTSARRPHATASRAPAPWGAAVTLARSRPAAAGSWPRPALRVRHRTQVFPRRVVEGEVVVNGRLPAELGAGPAAGHRREPEAVTELVQQHVDEVDRVAVIAVQTQVERRAGQTVGDLAQVLVEPGRDSAPPPSGTSSAGGNRSIPASLEVSEAWYQVPGTGAPGKSDPRPRGPALEPSTARWPCR